MGLNSWSGQILVGLVSEILGALVLGSIVVVGYLRFRRGKRQQLEAFFGLEGGREGSVHIFLSNIYVQAGGTVGVTHIDDGFTGSALTEGEYISALELADEIEEGPFRGLSRLLRGFFSDKRFESPSICEISMAPPGTGERSDFSRAGFPSPSGEGKWSSVDLSGSEAALFRGAQTVILIGSPVYNSLTDYVTRHPVGVEKTHFRFFRHVPGNASTSRGITFLQSGNPPGKPHERRQLSDDERAGVSGERPHFEEFFVIERLRGRRQGGRPLTVFVCAGTGTAATVWAVWKLCTWKDLRKDFENEPFCAMYSLETNDKEWVLSDAEGRYDDVSDDPIERFPRRHRPSGGPHTRTADRATTTNAAQRGRDVDGRREQI
jgi:hypothetical protein